MTYFLAAPIYVAAFAPLVLGEHVGWGRWSAIAVGFVGVLEFVGAGLTTAAGRYILLRERNLNKRVTGSRH